jgi:hypothetical protein
VKATRGDLVVLVRTVRNYSLIDGDLSRTEVDVAEVTSVTRDGKVKAARLLDSDLPLAIERYTGVVQTFLVPADSIDKDAAIAKVREHVWKPGTRLIQPYTSVDEVREVLRPFRLLDAAA